VAEYNRLSGRVGNIVNLDVVFYHNGIAEDPYAIKRIDIYKGAVKDENLEQSIILPSPDDPNYPYPVLRQVEGSGGDPLPGQFVLPFEVPTDFDAPEIYFDVWRFIGDDPGGTVDPDDEDESTWISQCNRFWVYPDNWYVDDELVTFRVGFEALDKHFFKPEVRNLEVGIEPLPLYDFDYNRIIPLIPQLLPQIHIETENGEVLVENDACKMGLRQGSYRTNPFVVQYRIDTDQFLIGTYKYRVTLVFPNGETRTSGDMRFDVS
jgi:hypothetical protein